MLAGGYGSEDKPEPNAMERLCENPMALLLNYADGLKATVCYLDCSQLRFHYLLFVCLVGVLYK